MHHGFDIWCAFTLVSPMLLVMDFLFIVWLIVFMINNVPQGKPHISVHGTYHRGKAWNMPLPTGLTILNWGHWFQLDSRISLHHYHLPCGSSNETFSRHGGKVSNPNLINWTLMFRCWVVICGSKYEPQKSCNWKNLNYMLKICQPFSTQ